ncbi:spore protease YyaC [Clostridium sp. 'White wine YQ']|uniref:spore protease YyaC n=1 Tax=Clostridium sp. 'White wine YQ' TaxID=3027474 RepID=UPI00236516C5|nr:spore protease YyaC [Clostridium sp. 'White wine YQ']MDD7795904.1 spore protease YyaC [Clostridium sp. 'White wine YQ']
MINKIANMKFFAKRKNNSKRIYYVQDTYTKITDYFNVIQNKNVVFVCIGTNRTHSVDALGPFIGSILKENKDFDIPIYGTLTDPINAKNINEKIKIIRTKHPKQILIAIDASLSAKEDVGKIIIKDSGLIAGKGIGKNHAYVGDISIQGIMGELELDVVRYYVDMKFLSDMAFEIAKGIIKSFMKC